MTAHNTFVQSRFQRGPHLGAAMGIGFALLVSTAIAQAQELTRTPLPATHPLIGTWRAEYPKLKCFEQYEIRADGTRSSQSAQERNESEFELAVFPSSKGFHKWTDRITKNNGKLDCSGSTTPVGHVAVNYIRLHPSGQSFLICEAEELKSCFAEFRRQR